MKCKGGWQARRVKTGGCSTQRAQQAEELRAATWQDRRNAPAQLGPWGCLTSTNSHFHLPATLARAGQPAPHTTHLAQPNAAQIQPP